MKYFVLLISCLWLVGCFSANQPVVTKPTSAQLVEFSKNSTITLPATAQAIGWLEERGMDDGLYLQIMIPAQDLQTFLDNTPLKNSTFSHSTQLELHVFKAFYKIAPTQYRSAQEWLPNARGLHILIDESDPVNAIVYLLWHET